jgi:hypothetical protein
VKLTRISDIGPVTPFTANWTSRGGPQVPDGGTPSGIGPTFVPVKETVPPGLAVGLALGLTLGLALGLTLGETEGEGLGDPAAHPSEVIVIVQPPANCPPSNPVKSRTKSDQFPFGAVPPYTEAKVAEPARAGT